MRNKLSIEQQFEIAKVRQIVENVDAPDLRLLIIELYETTFERENIVKELLASKWGIDVTN